MNEITHHITAAAYGAVCLATIVANLARKKVRRWGL